MRLGDPRSALTLVYFPPNPSPKRMRVPLIRAFSWDLAFPSHGCGTSGVFTVNHLLPKSSQRDIKKVGRKCGHYVKTENCPAGCYSTMTSRQRATFADNTPFACFLVKRLFSVVNNLGFRQVLQILFDVLTPAATSVPAHSEMNKATLGPQMLLCSSHLPPNGTCPHCETRWQTRLIEADFEAVTAQTKPLL